MNLPLEGKIRNYIFAAVLGLTLISLLVAFMIGREQDRAYRDNYAQYQQAVTMMGEQKYAQALQTFRGLDADSQASYQIQYMEGFCAGKSGDYAAAAQYMQQARETRPALLKDQSYLQRYGVILYKLGEYERAELYLRESLKYPEDAAVTEEVHNYLVEIDKNFRSRR